MSVITIRGQMGSGAPEIGRHLAWEINSDYVDREIIAKVAEKLHWTQEVIQEKETPPTTLTERIEQALKRTPYFFNTGNSGADVLSSRSDLPIDDPSYLSSLESVIKELANGPSIVICGRGSQFILKGNPHTFHILVVAPFDVRVKRVMDNEKISEREAKKKITSYDRSRREFIKRYFKSDLENPVNYDLVINTGYFSLQSVFSIIMKAIPLKNTES